MEPSSPSPKPCCEDPANRSDPETPNRAKPELTVTRCRVCGSSHYELTIDPVLLATEGTVL